MKTIRTILFILATITFTASCEGPVGPPGIDGLDGDSFIGSIFDIEGDFTSDNDYSLYYEFPPDFTVYDSDVVLVYILWEQADNMDVWRLLPQTLVLNEGILQYNFDYTIADVKIFLDGDVPFNLLEPGDLNDQVFRVAVLPGEFANNKSTDLTNFSAIRNAPNMKLNTLKSIDFTDSTK